MPAVVGAVALIDAESITRLMRSLDISGTGGGPWVPVHCLSDRLGEVIDRDNPLVVTSLQHAYSAFARAATTTPYSIGDIVTDSNTGSSFASAVPSLQPGRQGCGFVVKLLRLRKNTAGVSNAIFRVHLFKAAPTAIALDNGAFAATGNTNYLGVSSEGTMVAMGDGAQVTLTQTLSHRFGPSEDKLYWLLEARGAYTPVSGENFELETVVEHD